MKFEHTRTFNFEAAFRGMRNPLNSWHKSDSTFYDDVPILGENDLKLAQRLIAGGSEHRKFMRQIMVSVDITAPMYWWSEFDTYKVGTTANSTSKMHKLATTPITIHSFEIDDHEPELIFNEYEKNGKFYADIVGDVFTEYVEDKLEPLRKEYLKTGDKKYWKELLRLLPNSYLQTRTITFNYENLYAMVRQRLNHKLNEWSGNDNPYLPSFINWVRTLPYAKELIFFGLHEV